jgi:enolase-phosphatase E1
VSRDSDAGNVAAILLDIEGTTTPIAFVETVLFPYARARLASHLERHAASPEYDALLSRLRAEHATSGRSGETPPPWPDSPSSQNVHSAVVFCEWLMDRDRKVTPLKELQGRIWEDGYRGGELVGQLFDDVPAALQGWQQRHVPVGIFSSGSVRAQQLLFGHSCAGDLTPFLRWYFDTQVGPKLAADSYRRIARAINVSPHSVMFVSDVTSELDAAAGAGMQVRLSMRPGNKPISAAHGYETVSSLEELLHS